MDGASDTSAGEFAQESTDHSDRDQSQRSGHQRPARRAVTLEPLPPFFTIGRSELDNVCQSLKQPLSGYIGGNPKAGPWVDRLENQWIDTFGCRYATPCNSATSGLLAACMAADIYEGDLVWVSDYTMSASATCAILLGAEVKLLDIDPDYFCMTSTVYQPLPKVIIVTNLFGHPANLKKLREFCDGNKIILIEDNAQAPLATLHGQYTGTIGHIGVYSLNVHKHIQAGEGGVIVTNDPFIAHKLDCAINHGELMRVDPHMGLNLRMTEPIAAIACAQLDKAVSIIGSRIGLAWEISAMFTGIDFVQIPKVMEGAEHVYYMWAGKILGERSRDRRAKFLGGLQQRNVPFRAGYSQPLHRLLDTLPDLLYPTTCEMEDNRLFTFEICAHDPTARHLRRMKRIIHEEAANADRG